GEEYSCGSSDCAPGCDCDRYVEFWNLVFTQYISDGNGNYELMEHGNIDTGMGLERIACIMQGVDNLFEVDTIRRIMKHAEEISKQEYGKDEKTDVSLRVITDHIRSTVFMIGDGVGPSNEGRGYVLRRLLRRAARHGRLLGVNKPFLFELCDTVIDENLSAYGYLGERREYIRRVIKSEEDRFESTIDQGYGLLTSIIESPDTNPNIPVEGDIIFKLYDTFGFPVDLTCEILEERGYTADIDRYNELMELQRTRARQERKSKDEISWEEDIYSDLDLTQSEFTGYTEMICTAKVLHMLSDGETVETASGGDEVIIVLDKTPFYAESGGQVGDIGTIRSSMVTITINDCRKNHEGYFLHIGTVTNGVITVGDTVTAEVDTINRNGIMRNHTGTHLLQAALRDILGEHVHQSGSYVDDKRLRFDFSHFEAVTSEQLKQLEEYVNSKILDGLGVDIAEMPLEEAKQLGAMALFGEKYADVVRVVSIGDCSVEFCGGTHVDSTSSLGLFKIYSEGSVAAGIRRIEATTGIGVMEFIYSREQILNEVAEMLKTNSVTDIVRRTASLGETLQDYEKQIKTLKESNAKTAVGDMLSSFTDIDGLELRVAKLTNLDTATARSTVDEIKRNIANSVTIIASEFEGKVTFVVSCGKEAVEAGVNAGALVKQVSALTGGSGGGRNDFAMAGAGNTELVDTALAAAGDILREMIRK
ncbi:MAG: alanine--tRNA ligase, partial [Oscillospiraceae bacterium]|nr:alanine--tRNA ligase [Oscillospiraceae bacterium]